MKIISRMNSRILGCLYGQAIGDALGTRYEFQGAERVQLALETDRRTDGFLPILGGGPFELELGQVTDDTELAMALARCLIKENTFDQKLVANAYVDWFRSGPFDIGMTTHAALGCGDPVKNAQKHNQESLSNGCLMRSSPLALAGLHWPLESLTQAAKLDCQITNPNPIAQDAVAAYVTGVREAILTGDKKAAWEAAVQVAKSDVVQSHLKEAESHACPVKLPTGRLVQGDTAAMGYLGVAMQGAFHELLTSKSFADALVAIIARGGDTDTNGCIGGALLGAFYGADNIPEEWKRAVVSAKPQRINQYPAVDLSDLEDVALKLVKCQAPSTEN